MFDWGGPGMVQEFMSAMPEPVQEVYPIWHDQHRKLVSDFEKLVKKSKILMSYQEQLNILTKIIIDSDLKNTQNEFLKTNCSIFVDKEENEHDYNKIHVK